MKSYILRVFGNIRTWDRESSRRAKKEAVKSLILFTKYKQMKHESTGLQN
jgi:hypothetical protein